MNTTNMKVVAVFVLCMAVTAFCETVTVEDLHLVADATINVAVGSTQNVVRLTGGAYTLTKTGGGTLNIYWTSNENARVVVDEGVVALPRYARPTAVFAKAHFHVDASDPSTMVTECVNGTNFVVRWNDADGHTCYATNCPSTRIGRRNPQNRRAFLRIRFQNGLPVVDFGSLASKAYTNAQGVALGYGAAMEWSEPMVKTFREGFTVFSDTEDVYDAERGAFGGYAAAPFASFKYIANYRYDLPRAYFFVNTTYSLPLGRGTNILDLVKFMGPGKAYDKRPDEGFHILNGITTPAYIGNSYDKYFVDSFAAELCDTSAEESFGGQRIGEYAVFPEYLTDEERMEVSLYLKTKWFPRKFASIEVKAGATFDASEGGMECAVVDEEEGSTLFTGASSIVVNPVHPWKTVLHFDASKADTLDTVQVGGTNFVGRWSDCSGNGAYATTNAAESCRAPFINPNETLNGLPFVDFGSLRTDFNKNGAGEYLGYGAALKFDAERAYAEGITVAADTPDVVNGDWLSCPEYAKMHGMAFFATYKGSYGWWQRGVLAEGTTPTIKSTEAANAFRYGTNYLDGVKVDVQVTAYPAGFHVYSQSPKNVRADGSDGAPTHLGAEKCYASSAHNYVYGGQRVAEYALYNPKLTDTERTRAYRALRYKWFAETPLTRTLAALSIPAGGSYEVKYENVAVGNLELGGTLGALGVSASNVVVSSECATIAAPLALAPGAVLEIPRLADGSFALLVADSVTAAGDVAVVLTADDWSSLGTGTHRIVRGAVSGGRWTVNSPVPNVSARLVFDAEGVLVEFSRGFVLIYR